MVQSYVVGMVFSFMMKSANVQSYQKGVGGLKGQKREIFFYYSLVSRIESKDFIFFNFGRTLAAFSG
jgi:hypothetical protein